MSPKDSKVFVARTAWCSTSLSDGILVAKNRILYPYSPTPLYMMYII